MPDAGVARASRDSGLTRALGASASLSRFISGLGGQTQLRVGKIGATLGAQRGRMRQRRRPRAGIAALAKSGAPKLWQLSGKFSND